MEEHNEEKKVIRYHLERHKWPDEIQAEKEQKRKTIIIIFTCIACFLSGFLFHGILKKTSVSGNSEFAKLEQIYSLMENQWYFGKEDDDLSNTLLTNAINGMLENKWDPHTSYMSPQEYESFASSLQGNFVGIGIQYYALDEDTFMVERVFKGSGAEKGGMIKGDIIKAVDGVSVKGKDIDEIAAMIKGELDSTVKITVVRENKDIDLTIKRSVVNDSVYGYVEDGIGILEINTFAETSGDEVGKYLADFKKQGVKQLIIDLRDNGGGYVTAAMQIASYLVPTDAVVYQEQAKDGEIKSHKAYDDYERYTFSKMVILINEDTASASEVLTSCLKAHLKHASTVGVTSYGKGTVQIPITFEDGSSFKYTIAEWLTPKGEHINGVGIKPDYIVELDPAVTTGILNIPENTVYKADSVSPFAKPIQIYLKFLGYPADRNDEYFSSQSAQALKSYQKDHQLTANGEINEETIKSLLSSCAKKWHQNRDALDVQMKKALELVHK